MVAALVVVAAASAMAAGALVGRGALARRSRWLSACGVALAAVAALALYPDTWRGTIVAVLASAVSGTLIVFLATWGLTRTLLPGETSGHAPLLEIVRPELPVRLRSLAGHAWRVALAAALGASALVCAVEIVGEGLPTGVLRAILVLAVIVGLEALGVLLGFALFRRLLALG